MNNNEFSLNMYCLAYSCIGFLVPSHHEIEFNETKLCQGQAGIELTKRKISSYYSGTKKQYLHAKFKIR